MKSKELKDFIYRNVFQNTQNGYVLTSPELASEIIDNLPKSVFESDTTTFLDPICKSGTFLFEIVERLYDKGHSISNIQSRIFTVDFNYHSLNIAQSTIRKLLNSGIEINHQFEWIETYYNRLIIKISQGKYSTLDEFMNMIMLDKQDLIIMEKFKMNITQFIEQYEKVSKLESKLFGEVFTPRKLIDLMLDTLPEEVWKKKDLKWLDPAVGIGNFPAAILERLMIGLKDEISNEEERKKWILEEMLYMCDISTKNLFLLYMLFDKNKEYKLNVYRGSFLEDGFDKHMKEVWKVNGFDVIVGNPPYQLGKDSNFYVKFIHKFKSIGLPESYLSFIVPNRFFQPSHKAHIAIKDYKVIKLFHNLTPHFVGISTHIGGFLIQKDISNYTQLVDCVFESGIHKIDFSKPIPTDPRLSNPIYQDLIKKIVEFPNKISFTSKDEKSNIFIKRQWKRWNSLTGVGGDHVFNVIIDYQIDRDGADGKWISYSDTSKMDWYLSKSNLIRFLTKSFASAMNVPPFVWRIIPEIPLHQINNNQDVYNFFKLTLEEINLIESNLK